MHCKACGPWGEQLGGALIKDDVPPSHSEGRGLAIAHTRSDTVVRHKGSYSYACMHGVYEAHEGGGLSCMHGVYEAHEGGGAIIMYA